MRKQSEATYVNFLQRYRAARDIHLPAITVLVVLAFPFQFGFKRTDKNAGSPGRVYYCRWPYLKFLVGVYLNSGAKNDATFSADLDKTGYLESVSPLPEQGCEKAPNRVFVAPAN